MLRTMGSHALLFVAVLNVAVTEGVSQGSSHRAASFLSTRQAAELGMRAREMATLHQTARQSAEMKVSLFRAAVRMEADVDMLHSFLHHPANTMADLKVAAGPQAHDGGGASKILAQLEGSSPDAQQLPALLAVMKEMYGRFKDNIGHVNKLEVASKKEYAANLQKQKGWSNAENKQMGVVTRHWKKQRELSHAHYHSMLRMAHSGMANLKNGIEMVEKALAGKPLDSRQMQMLKGQAPELVFAEVREKLLRFCTRAKASFRKPTMKKMSGLLQKKARQKDHLKKKPLSWPGMRKHHKKGETMGLQVAEIAL